MKAIIFLSLLLSSYFASAGVGGSVGGSGKGNGRSRDVNYFTQSPRYNVDIPSVEFKTDEYYETVQVTNVCIRNGESLETKEAIKVKRKNIFTNEIDVGEEVLVRNLIEKKRKVKFHIFKPNEIYETEEKIKTEYQFEIYSMSSGKEKDPRLVKTINYKIPECD